MFQTVRWYKYGHIGVLITHFQSLLGLGLGRRAAAGDVLFFLAPYIKAERKRIFVGTCEHTSCINIL